MPEKDKQNPVPRKQIRMSLTTHEKARRALARLIREFRRSEKEEKDVAGFRALVYAFSTLLQFFSFDKSVEIEERLEKIEERLKALGHEKV